MNKQTSFHVPDRAKRLGIIDTEHNGIHNNKLNATLSIMTLSIMTLSIMTLSIMTLSVITLSIVTLSKAWYSVSFMLSVTYKPYC
jgi:hypothetical protein